jgi:hypothetical protein
MSGQKNYGKLGHFSGQNMRLRGAFSRTKYGPTKNLKSTNRLTAVC